MARKDRTGNRKPREQRPPVKIPELGYYLVVTDTEAESFGIMVGWSNPCFEIWMHSYYGSMPAIMESWVCCSEFEKVFERNTGQRYSKSDMAMYEKIFRTGDEEKALQIAKRKHEQCLRDGKTVPSQMCPCTTVYQLVQ